MAKRLAGRYGYPPAPQEFEVTLHRDRLDQPLRWRKPRRVFVVSMGDLFHEVVPMDYISQVFGVMSQAKQHTFQVLTKRPMRLLQFYQRAQHLNDWVSSYPNVWVGITAEDQLRFYERYPYIAKIPAPVIFVSFEPLLSHIDMGGATPGWVICGGESGPGARPMSPTWARSLRDQCQCKGVPFFFKQWGDWVGPYSNEAARAGWDINIKKGGRVLDGKVWNEYPNI
jgi:protein gp37